MVGWHHELNGHEFGKTPGVGDGQGGLACYGSQGCKESNTTEVTEHACEKAYTIYLTMSPMQSNTPN